MWVIGDITEQTVQEFELANVSVSMYFKVYFVFIYDMDRICFQYCANYLYHHHHYPHHIHTLLLLSSLLLFCLDDENEK